MLIDMERKRTYQAGLENILRETLKRRPENIIHAQPIGSYGVEDKSFWNPNKDALNVFEFYEKQGNTAMGVQWTVDVAADHVHKQARLYWQARMNGNNTKVEVIDAAGKIIFENNLGALPSLLLRQVDLTFPAAGSYTIKLTGQPENAREHGGHIAKVAYLLFN